MSRLGTLGALAITPTRLLFVLLLILTWWLGRLFPRYKPMVEAQVSSRIQEARKMIPNIKLDWPADPDPRVHFNASKLALLIEARPIPHLVPQMLHMISVVPPDWRFLFIGSRESLFSMSKSYAIKHQQVIGKLDLMELPLPWTIETREDVFRMLTDVRFYDEFLPGVEWILKYEYDSILCANAETSLDDWLEWSWAGSPRTEDGAFSGNGGLSLRRVSAIKRVLSFQSRFNDSEPDDDWFGKRLTALPGAKVASKFDGALAVEDVYMEKPMGYHVRGGGANLNENVWDNSTYRKLIFEYCPELSMIMDMKLERERCPPDDPKGEGGGGYDGEEEEYEEPMDISVTYSVVGEDGEITEVRDQGGAEAMVRPPGPPPLPQSWEDIVASAEEESDVDIG